MAGHDRLLGRSNSDEGDEGDSSPLLEIIETPRKAPAAVRPALAAAAALRRPPIP